MTRFSRLHPYPAMIADELAVSLSERFVTPGARVLDPFCGTGRNLIASAERGAYCVGLDINPLAVMLTRAKAINARTSFFEKILTQIPRENRGKIGSEIYELEPGRSVEWFSPLCRKELSEIIHWFNQQQIQRREQLLLASVLSATVREVSYCRKDQWKLHRLSVEKRKRFNKSAWSVFERRCQTVLRELKSLPPLEGKCRTFLGDARSLRNVLARNRESDRFDLVVTSPPYGDSLTTVSYGGMSGICLGVLKHLNVFGLPYLSGRTIDRLSLGGVRNVDCQTELYNALDFARYWCGGQNNSRRKCVLQFLHELADCCTQICEVLHQQAQVVFVIARRKVSGRRVYLDRFLQDFMESQGFFLKETITRQIKHNKSTPLVINRNGRQGKARTNQDRVITMKQEILLVFCRE